MMENIDLLLNGSIDMHIHHGPDTEPRRLDALEAAKQAQQAGMRAIVLKCHHYPTAPLAILTNQLVPGIKVFGSICLDKESGGLNVFALESSAKMGAKVVWMPTVSSVNSIVPMRKFGVKTEGKGLSTFDAAGRLMPEIDTILTLVKRYDMVLASGHLSPAETFALIEAARQKKVKRMIITHPLDTEFVEKALSLEELKQLAGMGAFIEHTGVGLLPNEWRRDPAEMAAAIRFIGVERCIMSTDLGQFKNLLPAEGMRLFIATMLRNGLKEQEIETMVKTNPAWLLGLDERAN